MKLNQEELHAALRLLCRKIEACGASTEITDAVVLADLIRQSVGNKDNPPNEFSAASVRAQITHPHDPSLLVNIFGGTAQTEPTDDDDDHDPKWEDSRDESSDPHPDDDFDEELPAPQGSCDGEACEACQ